MAWGMWRYGGNRSSDEETLACYPFPRPLVPPPGGGGLFEACGRWGVGGEGAGDECVDLMFFSPRVLDSFYRLPMCSFPRCRLVFRLVCASRGGVLFFLSGRLVACSYRSYSSRLSSRAASRRTSRFPVSSCLLVSFFSSAFPLGRLVLFRAAVFPSRHIVLPWRLTCPSRFFFIRLIALRICDEAFLRGRLLPYHPDGRAARSLIACSSRWRWRYPLPGPCYPVMRRRGRRHGEENGEMS